MENTIHVDHVKKRVRLWPRICKSKWFEWRIPTFIWQNRRQWNFLLSVYTGLIESHVLYVWRGEVIIIQNCDYQECLIFHPGTTSTQNILAYTYWPKTWLQKLSNILPPRNYVYSKHFGLYILTKDLTAKVKQHLVKLNFWSQVKLHKMLKDQSTVGVVFCRQFSLNKNRYYVWNKIENSLV